MQKASKFRIGAFPRGGDYWRVDWIGNLHINPEVKSEQLVTVFLSRLKLASTQDIHPYNALLIDKDHRRTAEIGVGLLPIVWIGSVWKDGFRVDGSIKYETRTIEVDTTHVTPIQFADVTSQPPHERLIPPFEYPLGNSAWQCVKNSPLFGIETEKDSLGLLIPAIEIIRFYYIYSSSSARCIFFGEYDSLIDDFEINNGDVIIKLAWYAHHKDAWSLARYIASKTMQEGAKQIYNWVRTSNSNHKESRYSKSIFPFTGKTRLTVEGQQIKGDDGVIRFLGMRIRHCTHKMPFSSITLRVERNVPQASTPEERLPIWATTWPTGIDPQKHPFKSNEEPNRQIDRMILEANEERFGDLKGRELTKRYEKRSSKKRKIANPEDVGEKSGLGTSEGKYGKSDLVATEINQDVQPGQESRSPSLQNFIRALQYLRNQGLRVETILVGKVAKREGREIISHFQKNGSSLRQWSVIQSRPEKIRGVIIAEVHSASKCAYILEIERDPNRANEKYSVLIISKPKHEEIKKSELNTFLTECALYGRWPPKRETRQYKRESVPHRAPPKPTDSSLKDKRPKRKVGKSAGLGLGLRILSALQRLGVA